MKKLKETIENCIKAKNYAKFGKIATAIEYIVEESMMDVYDFSMPLVQDAVADAFLAELKLLGFPMDVSDTVPVFSADTMTLADQYPDADYLDVSNAWWTALLTAIDTVVGISGSSAADAMCDFLSESDAATTRDVAKEVLGYVANGFPDEDE